MLSVVSSDNPVQDLLALYRAPRQVADRGIASRYRTKNMIYPEGQD